VKTKRPVKKATSERRRTAGSLERQVLRAARDYVKASRAYNYDCNTRLDVKPGDPKRHALFWASQNAFQRMCRLVEEGTQNKKGQP